MEGTTFMMQYMFSALTWQKVTPQGICILEWLFPPH